MPVGRALRGVLNLRKKDLIACVRENLLGALSSPLGQGYLLVFCNRATYKIGYDPLGYLSKLFPSLICVSPLRW